MEARDVEPEMPDWLTGRAAELWPDVAAVLRPMGLLSADYTVGLALLVDAMADWIYYARRLADDPENENAWRWEKRKREAWADVHKQHREFGLTPSAMRSVAKHHGGQEQSDDDDIKPYTPKLAG